MRLSAMFGRTLREAPAEAEGEGYRRLVRGGYVRPARSQSYIYLPLGEAALERIAKQFNAADGLSPAPLALSPATDAATAIRALAGSEVQSYRQLPARLTAAASYMRPAVQSRGGPLNAAAGPGRIWATLAGDAAAVGASYAAYRGGLERAFAQCRVPVVAAQDGAPASPATSYAFLTPDGGETLLLCDGCGYVAMQEAAACARPAPPAEELRPLEKVATPHCATIADLAALLQVPESRTAKAVFLMAAVGDGERFVFAVVRGDTDVSERKLRLALAASSLRPATEAEIRATGAEPGYASPIGLKRVFVVVDPLVAASPNLVAGANEAGYHLLNTNAGRDYTASLVADIAAAHAKDPCPACAAELRAVNAAILGRCARYAPGPLKEAWPVHLDATGKTQPTLIALSEVDFGATLAAVAESHGDDQGLTLPAAVAPRLVHLVLMQGAEAEAAALYDALLAAGIPCLFDDRSESPGVKFADADLIGLPLRITLGKRSLQAGGAEFKLRSSAEKLIVPLEAAVSTAAEMLAGA